MPEAASTVDKKSLGDASMSAAAAVAPDRAAGVVHIVVHYHELWLKGGNRKFFLTSCAWH